MSEKVVKIYLPENVPKETLYLYGNLKCCEKYFTYFVIKWTSRQLIESGDNVINFLGMSSTSEKSKIPEYENCLEVQLNQNDISDVKITIQKKLINPSCIQLIYYNSDKFLQVSKNLHPEESLNKNDFCYLAQLLRAENSKNPNKSFIQRIPQYIYKSTMFVTSIGSKILSPIEPLFEKTAIFKHFRTWKKCLDDKNSHGSIVFDILLGLIVFALLSRMTQPAKYFMDIAELIVNKLRHLLEMLEGSPVGLKLNVQLNNFLLSCFMYHVDLWWNFIIIVEPAIDYLFIPLGVLGMFGISFQSAMLCDVITLITLHAHCFYIYAAFLYKIEISSIQSLMRIVLGRRKNILKNRVESQEYSNRQLYLATLFFTTFLFLLPTVITYYVVFATLRFLVYLLTYFLMTIQRQFLIFPFYKYLRWICGSYRNTSNLSMTVIGSRKLKTIQLLTLHIVPKISTPWKKNSYEMKSENLIPKPMSLGVFAKGLLKGELMAFLQPSLEI